MVISSKLSQDNTQLNYEPADLANIHALAMCSFYSEVTDESLEWTRQSLEMTQERMCRHLLEAGADLTISTPNWNSYFESQLCIMSKVIKNSSQSYHYPDIEQDSIAVLLNHAYEFLAYNSEVDLRLLVFQFIYARQWTVEIVAFLLQMSGSQLPVQDLSNTLPQAILGSHDESESGISKVLILLLKAGADVDGSGEIVSKIACNPRKTYIIGGKPLETDDVYYSNHDLRLRQIWATALTTCGYDAEEYITQSTRFEELSDIDDNESLDEIRWEMMEMGIEMIPVYNENLDASTRTVSGTDAGKSVGTERDSQDQWSGTISDEDDIFTTRDQADFPKLNRETSDSVSASETDGAYQPPDFAPYNTSEWAFLEEEAHVWRD